MKLEHFALNVPDPKAQAAWYVEHLGMRMVVDLDDPPYLTFVADEAGAVIEMYHNDKFPIPDYNDVHPTTFHIAFNAEDIEAEKERLLAAGASDTGIVMELAGARFCFVRDPWGVPLQLLKRPKPLLS